MNDYQPTARLRWVKRTVPVHGAAANIGQFVQYLQQWWAPDVPGYMRDQKQGEWRDVPTETE